MTLADLAVRIRADVSDFKQGMAQARTEMQSTSDTAEEAGAAMDRGLGFDNITAHATQFIATLQAMEVAVQGIRTVAEAGFEAIQKSADMQQMLATLEAITGSADRAAAKMRFFRELAAPSPFTTLQLAAAGTQLEAFGLRSERLLPILSKMGAAFKADNEHLMELSRIMGEIGNGQFPHMEQLGAFGLNRGQFAAKGIKFDASGQMLSSAEDAFNALEKIIDEKYPGILDKMNNTTNAKLATWQDSYDRAVIVIGDILSKHLAPWLERVTALVDTLSSNGSLAKWAENAAKAMDGIATALEVVGAVIFGFAYYHAVLGFMQIAFAVIALTEGLTAAAGAAAILDALLGNAPAVAAALVATGAAALAFALMHRKMEDIKRDLDASLKGATSGPMKFDTGDFSNTGSDKALEASKEGNKPYKRTAAETATIKHFELLRDNQNKFKEGLIDYGTHKTEPGLNMWAQNKMIELGMAPHAAEQKKQLDLAHKTSMEIAHWTRTTAQNTGDVLTLRRQALGGGASGQIGATPIEMGGSGGWGRSAGNSPYAHPGGVASQLDRAVRAIVVNQQNNGLGQGFRPR